MFMPMVISGLTVDPLTNSPIVILKEVNGERTLPIWIGLLEATAIASELEGIKFSRPMTHDLLIATVRGLDAKLERLIIDKMVNNTFHAKLEFKTKDGQTRIIDARPSDGIALAVRTSAAIFVEEDVIKKAAITKIE